MSRPSPYRKSTQNHRDISPSSHSPGFNLTKLAEKYQVGRSPLMQSKKSIYPMQDMRRTEKKRADPTTFRIETLIEQNKFLLSENNELSSLLDNKCKMIIALENKLEQQIAQEIKTLDEIEHEKDRFIAEFNHKTKMYEHNIQNLLNELGMLSQEKGQLEVQHEETVQMLKNAIHRDSKQQIEAIAYNHAKSMELMDHEQNKLKLLIEEKNNQIEQLYHQNKQITDSLKNETELLNSDLQHTKHLKKMELSEQKIYYDNIIDGMERELRKEKEINNHEHQLELKKIKNQLILKKSENEGLEREVSTAKIQNNIKEHELMERKTELEGEINRLQHFFKSLLDKEIRHNWEVSDAGYKNMEQVAQIQTDQLSSENKRLHDLIKDKNLELDRLLQQIKDSRNNHEKQQQEKDRVIQQLKNKLVSVQGSHQEEDELFKAKLAHLREADITALKNYYENETKAYVQDIANREGVLKENRDKLQQEIQQKNQLRKEFELENEKLRIRIGELQLTLVRHASEKREQIGNITSQIELTSMTMIREADEKHKHSAINEQEVKKLQNLITAKDHEIEELNRKITIIKNNHDGEVADLQERISLINQNSQDLEEELKKEKAFYSSDLKKKENTIKNNKEFYEGEISRIKDESSHEYHDAVNELTAIKGKLELQIMGFKATIEDLKEKMVLLKESTEQGALEREATHGGEKNRIKTEGEKSQINQKNFYETKLAEKDQEIKNTRQELMERESDMRDLKEKYRQLEKKLEQLMESQEKLRDMENRIISLGQENNVVKNLSQLIKNRRKA